MRYVSWNPALVTGYAEVDDQHRELYALVNDLNAAALVGVDSAQVDQILRRILRYASVHFSTEEALMERTGYPGTDEHTQLHAEFAEHATEFANAFADGQGKPVPELAAFMQDWLETHIRTVDRPLVDHVRAWTADQSELP